ncbi:MAG: alpha/beta hydrolase [Bacteroidales bacterium]|jgi:pimeloyl-ACP methyl ester carboxylesterase
MESPADSDVKEYKHFREVLKDSLFTLSQIKEALLAIYPEEVEKNPSMFKIIDLLDTTRTVRSTAITYLTKDPKGNEVLASGLVVTPVGRRIKGVLHFFPAAKVNKAIVGTKLMLSFEGILGFFGYTVIIPDLLGYGVSEDKEYPFLFPENTGQVAYDMHLAAGEYFHSLGQSFSREVIIAGYSMGGMGVVALHKHIETKGKEGFVVKHSYPGGGIYDLHKTLHFYRNEKSCNHPFMPYMFVALDYWYDLDLDYSQIFKEPLLSNMKDWLSRKYPVQEVAKFLGSDITKYMHDDFFTSEGNESLNNALASIKGNSVFAGWNPHHPMTIIHSLNDQVAPFPIAQEMYRAFYKKGSPVTLLTSKEDHFGYGIEYFGSLLIYLTVK